MLDEDVARFLLMLLADTTVSVAGREVSAVAELHARAVAQVTSMLENSNDGRDL